MDEHISEKDREKMRFLYEKMEMEGIGAYVASNKACHTCEFAHGEALWSTEGRKLNPDIDFCQIFVPSDGGKPFDVAFKGAPCKFYEKYEPLEEDD